MEPCTSLTLPPGVPAALPDVDAMAMSISELVLELLAEVAGELLAAAGDPGNDSPTDSYSEEGGGLGISTCANRT